MATSIFEQLANSGIDLNELENLIKESQDPTAEGREKRKMSIDDIFLYDWEQMSEKEKSEAAANVGLPVNEVDNRLREKSVETKMEFQNTDKFKKIQKSAQAIMDQFKGKNLEGNKNWDRDITMFEDAYGKENADKLRELMRPDIDSNISAPEGSTSTMGGLNIPSAEEIDTLIDEAAERKKNTFIESLKEKTDPDLTEELKIVDKFDAEQEKNKSGSSDPFAGSSTSEEEGGGTPVQFIPSGTDDLGGTVSEMLEGLIMGSEAGGGAATVFSDSENSEVTVPSGTEEVIPYEPVERIFSEDAEYTDETITEQGDHADPFAGTNVDIFTEETELIEEDLTDEQREEAIAEREEQELVDQFIAGNLPEPKEKTKVGKFLQKLVGKNKDKKNKKNKKNKKGGSNIPTDAFSEEGELTKYYEDGGTIKYMGGGKMSPMMRYLMGGKAPKYDNGGMTDIEPTVMKSDPVAQPVITPEIQARLDQLRSKPDSQLTDEEYFFIKKYSTKRYDTGGSVDDDDKHTKELKKLSQNMISNLQTEVHPTVLKSIDNDLFDMLYPSGVMHSPFKGDSNSDAWKKQVANYNRIMSDYKELKSIYQ
jgi:hypothetical protein